MLVSLIETADLAEYIRDGLDVDDIRKEEAIRTVVKACKPWDDDSGASYPEAAELVDFKDSWVGNRVREWKRGEYRDLVAGPNGDAA